MLKKLVQWSRLKSPWILHFNSGACNACDIEILAAVMLALAVMVNKIYGSLDVKLLSKLKG